MQPKRIALKEAAEKLAKANEQLAEVNGKVKELTDRLDLLTKEYDKANGDMAEAQDIADRGKTKLELAQRLTNALGSEGTASLKMHLASLGAAEAHCFEGGRGKARQGE